MFRPVGTDRQSGRSQKRSSQSCRNDRTGRSGTQPNRENGTGDRRGTGHERRRICTSTCPDGQQRRNARHCSGRRRPEHLRIPRFGLGIHVPPDQGKRQSVYRNDRELPKRTPSGPFRQRICQSHPKKNQNYPYPLHARRRRTGGGDTPLLGLYVSATRRRPDQSPWKRYLVCADPDQRRSRHPGSPLAETGHQQQTDTDDGRLPLLEHGRDEILPEVHRQTGKNAPHSPRNVGRSQACHLCDIRKKPKPDIREAVRGTVRTDQPGKIRQRLQGVCV